jgi:hypothetical protein
MVSQLTDLRNSRFVELKHGRIRQKKPGRIANRLVDALADVPDIRDRMYEPALVRLERQMAAPGKPFIMDQGEEGACTGFALAAVVNNLLTQQGDGTTRVSPHMLYEMAKRHDEWPGEKYSGSSLRGALRGWYNNGVCRLDAWPNPADTEVTLARARQARSIALGAYYRLGPNLPDFHAALSEVGVIYVSAAVHDGWQRPDPKNPIIPPSEGTAGLHAFAIVGYDLDGFWVQNSWGESWGKGGLARWLYEDWAANLEDAWVARLALPTPKVFGLSAKTGTGNASEFWGKTTPPPARSDIAGHYVHIDDGNFSPKQPYWSTQQDVEEAAGYVAGEPEKYQHLLLYAHGGLNSPDAAAVRIRAMTPVFKANGIYPYSVMYDTGLAETLKDLIRDHANRVFERTAGFTDLTDGLIEAALRKIGTALWDDMKNDATLPFRDKGDGTEALRIFLEKLSKRPKSAPIGIHVVGHSTGAVLVGRLLQALDGLVGGGGLRVESCSLMAPACTIKFFQECYAPRLGAGAAANVKLKNMAVFNLTDKAELDDMVTPLYRKSLLYLVSDAFERADEDEKTQDNVDRRSGEAFVPKPLLGMQKFTKDLDGQDGLVIRYAAANSPDTRSTTHGGFDNDPYTMNSILKNVLGGPPRRPFTASDLNY